MIPPPPELPEGWEAWQAFLAAQLPQPVDVVEDEDGSLAFTGGDPPEVFVRLTPRTIRVGRFAGGAAGRSAGATTPRWLGAVRWRRMPADDAIPIVEALVRIARGHRQPSLRDREL